MITALSIVGSRMWSQTALFPSSRVFCRSPHGPSQNENRMENVSWDAADPAHSGCLGPWNEMTWWDEIPTLFYYAVKDYFGAGGYTIWDLGSCTRSDVVRVFGIVKTVEQTSGNFLFSLSLQSKIYQSLSYCRARPTSPLFQKISDSFFEPTKTLSLLQYHQPHPPKKKNSITPPIQPCPPKLPCKQPPEPRPPASPPRPTSSLLSSPSSAPSSSSPSNPSTSLPRRQDQR